MVYLVLQTILYLLYISYPRRIGLVGESSHLRPIYHNPMFFLQTHHQPYIVTLARVHTIHPWIITHHFNLVPQAPIVSLSFQNNGERRDDGHYHHHIVRCIWVPSSLSCGGHTHSKTLVSKRSLVSQGKRILALTCASLQGAWFQWWSLFYWA
jgi:hypothetical protein